MFFLLFYTRFLCVFRYYPAKQNRLKQRYSAEIFI
nr:MAG TPA: hypothetical protein [Caudoviricetes sp.]